MVFGATKIIFCKHIAKQGASQSTKISATVGLSQNTFWDYLLSLYSDLQPLAIAVVDYSHYNALL